MTTTNHKLIISIIAAILAVSLLCTVCFIAQGKVENADRVYAASDYSADCTSQDGTIQANENTEVGEDGRVHYKVGKEPVPAGKTLVNINSQAELHDFMKNNAGKYGVLKTDIALDWTGTTKTFFGGANSSDQNLDASAVLDGNGYNISIKGGVGTGKYSAHTTTDNKEIMPVPNKCDEQQDNGKESVQIIFTGFLFAKTMGEIKNTTFEFTSSHAFSGSQDINGNQMLFSNGDKYLASAGIVTGGLIGGKIDNCRLNVNKPFVHGTSYKGYTLANTYYQENGAFTGGIAGLATHGGSINNVTVDIKTSGSIISHVNGCSVGANSTRSGLAIAGGVVGNYAPTTTATQGTQLNYITLMGTGNVEAYVGYASGDANFQTFPGGVMGASMYLTGWNSWKNYAGTNEYTRYYDGQNVNENNAAIKGIISGWQGKVRHNLRRAFGKRDENGVTGTLFGAVAGQSGDVSKFKGVATLFDYVGKRDGADAFDIEHAASLKYTDNAVQIYPDTTNGNLNVSFDKRPETVYMFRVKAAADGYDATQLFSQDYAGASKADVLNAKEYGYFIWSVDNNGSVVTPEDVEVAEVRYIAPTASGSYVYTFGEALQYSYTSNNVGENGNAYRAYNGQSLIDPTFTLTGKSGAVTPATTDGKTYQKIGVDGNPVLDSSGNPETYTKPAYQLELRTILQDNVIGDHSRAKLPGNYKYRAKYDGKDTFAYMDYANRQLARYEKDNNNVFSIRVATLNVTGNVENWVQQANLNLSIGEGATAPFDLIRYTKSGIMSDFVPTGGTVSHTFAINETTSEYGDAYTFDAYCTEQYPDGRKINVLVAQSEGRVVVNVDASAPTMSNVQYFRETTTDTWTPITELEATTNWVKSRIKMTYELSDDGRSGISSVNGGKIVDNSTSIWKCETIMDKGQVYTITCTDQMGNVMTKEVNVSIDTVDPTLNVALGYFNTSDFYDYNDIKCYSRALPVEYNATIGGSGYELWASISKDENGEDVWFKTNADFKSTSVEILDNIFQYAVQFKLRNVSKLYGDEEGFLPPVSLSLETYNTPFYVRLAIGDVYLTLEDIVYTGNMQDNDGASMNGLTFAVIKAKGMLNKLFAKEYDGQTNGVLSNVEVRLYNDTGSYIGKGGGMHVWNIYNTNDTSIRPKSDYFEMVVNYASANAGTTTLTFAIQGKADAERHDKLYPVVFVDSVDHDANGLVSSANVVGRANEEVAGVVISPCKMDINVSDFVKEAYTYGDSIPTTFDQELKYDKGAFATFTLTGGLKTRCDAGSYNVSATIDASLYPNYTFNIVERKGVTVGKKVVYATSYLDGEQNWVPYITFTGKSYTLTADMRDLDNNVIPLSVEFYKDANRTETNIYKGEDGNPLTTIRNAGDYYVKFIASADVAKNYEIGNVYEYEIKIDKGFIPVNLDTDEQEYNIDGKAIQYKYTVNLDPEANLYSSSDFSITYYKYGADAEYDPITKKMVKGKPDGTPIAPDQVKAVGYYAVKVMFKGNDNFYQKSFDDTLLVIKKAVVEIQADDIALTYDGKGHIYNSKDGNLKLWSPAYAKEITDANIVKRASINKYDFASGKYVPVDPIKDSVTNAGKYKFYLSFAENESYQPAVVDPKTGSTIKEVNLVVNKAKFEGVVFQDKTVDYNKNAVIFESNVKKLTLPDSTKVTYTQGVKSQEEPFSFTDAGKYTVELKLERTNYETFTTKAVLTINTIDLVGIQADITQNTVTYDGKEHTAMIFGNGLKQEADGTFSYNGVKANVSKDNVTGVNAGTYEGSYTIMVKNYKPLTVKTTLVIEQAELTATELDYSQITGMDSANFNVSQDFRNVKGSYTDVNGNVVEKGFRFYLIQADGSEKEVGLTEEGTLVAGKYRAYVGCDTNYKATTYAEFEIVNPNKTNTTPTDKKSSINLYVVIGSVCGGVVVIGIVVGVVIALQKKKKSSI